MEHEKPSQPIDHAAGRAGAPPAIEGYLLAMSKAQASDLHLKSDSPPRMRIKTEVMPAASRALTGGEIMGLAAELMTEKQKAFFAEHGTVDLAYEIAGFDRYRINVFLQRGSPSVAVRRVNRRIPTFEELNLPPVVAAIAEERTGLVLLSGPAGSGKSTTIAAMIQHINRTQHCHIVTVEDPIEYLYTDDKALINQREIGIDVESFPWAIRHLMRQDPDVILIGELRDRETFEAALYAAETGHLVLGTVHASSAPQTIGRILDLFPADLRPHIRQVLAFNLRAVVCQRLLPSIVRDMDRAPAIEVMLTNPSVRQLISEGRDGELPEVIRSHEREGMRSFTRSLLDLLENGVIDPKSAYEAAPNVDELKMMMKGISAGRSGLLGRQ